MKANKKTFEVAIQILKSSFSPKELSRQDNPNLSENESNT
jgi:hypothetical protein